MIGFKPSFSSAAQWPASTERCAAKQYCVAFGASPAATNAAAPALWHLVSDSNSVPVKGFLYGDYIRGMKPYVKGSRPQPLATNVTYRLFVKAGSLQGEHDFGLGTAAPAN